MPDEKYRNVHEIKISRANIHSNKRKEASVFHYLFLSAVLIWLSAFLFSADISGAAEVIAKFTVVEGTVDVLRGGALPAVAAKAGDTLSAKDIIRTKSG